MVSSAGQVFDCWYCDKPGYSRAIRRQEGLRERVYQAIRVIHTRHGIGYRYGKWRAMLREFEGGRLDVETRASPRP